MKKAAVLLSIIALAIGLTLPGCGGKRASVESSAVESSAVESSSIGTTQSPVPYNSSVNYYTSDEQQYYDWGYEDGYQEGSDAYDQDPNNPGVPDAPLYEDLSENPEQYVDENLQSAFADGWETGYEDGWDDAASVDTGDEDTDTEY